MEGLTTSIRGDKHGRIHRDTWGRSRNVDTGHAAEVLVIQRSRVTAVQRLRGLENDGLSAEERNETKERRLSKERRQENCFRR